MSLPSQNLSLSLSECPMNHSEKAVMSSKEESNYQVQSHEIEITNKSMKIEINEKGTITGRYPGNQLATIDN
jgi:hypothetical protein